MQSIMLLAVALLVGFWTAIPASGKDKRCTKEWGSPKFFQMWYFTVEECLENGASPHRSAKNNKWGAPIYVAAKYADNVEVLHLLVKAGANPTGRGRSTANTPLHYAASAWGIQNVDMVKALLAYGADPNARNVYGSTPLMWAFSGKAKREASPEIVETLLRAGADPNMQNQQGESAMTNVSTQRNRNLLVQAGALYNPRRKVNSGTLEGLRAGLNAGAVAMSSGANANTTALSAGAAASRMAALTNQISNAANQPLGQLQTSGPTTVQAASAPSSQDACQIPGYPNDPGPGLSFTWCPSGVSLQSRAASLQVAVLQCEIATGLLNEEQVSERKTQIDQLCERIDDMASSNAGPLCQCPQESRDEEP